MIWSTIFYWSCLKGPWKIVRRSWNQQQTCLWLQVQLSSSGFWMNIMNFITNGMTSECPLTSRIDPDDLSGPDFREGHSWSSVDELMLNNWKLGDQVFSCKQLNMADTPVFFWYIFFGMFFLKNIFCLCILFRLPQKRQTSLGVWSQAVSETAPGCPLRPPLVPSVFFGSSQGKHMENIWKHYEKIWKTCDLCCCLPVT